MNVSGIIVRSLPEEVERVSAGLAALPGVDVHAAQPDGRIIITIEDTTAGSAADTYTRLHDVEGVVSVALVYEYSDDGLNSEEAQP